MKKSQALCQLLAVSLACSLCACNQKEAPEPKQEPQKAQAVEQQEPEQHKTAAEIAAEKLQQKQAEEKGQDAAKLEPPAPKPKSNKYREYKPVEPMQQGLAQNELLTEIPDGSFFTFASCGNFMLDRPDVRDFFQHISALIMAQIAKMDIADGTPYQKATVALFKGMFRSFSPQKLKSLGLTGEKSPQFAFYFVRQTPVFKMALEDGEKFRQIVESYWEQNNVETRRAENVSTQWTLIKIDDDMPMELAIKWDEHRVTMTILGDMEHAGQILPELMMHPFEGRTGLSQLSQIAIGKNAAAVGMFDFNAMLNQFVQVQETAKKLTGKQGSEIDRDCVKDYRRIVNNIPQVGIQAELVSGGPVLGIDLKFMLNIKQTAWLKDLLAWKPKHAEFDKTAEMPTAEGYISLPTQILLTGFRAFAQDVKREPFKCSSLTTLNDFADMESSMDEEFTKQFDSILSTDHHLNGVMYSSAFTSNPLIAAMAYHSDNAAKVAATLDLVKSEKLNAIIEADKKKAEEEAAMAELMAKNPKLAKEKMAADAAKAAKAAEEAAANPEEAAKAEQDAISIYDDAKLNEESLLKNINGLGRYTSYLTDQKFVLSHKTFGKEGEKIALKDAPSLIHIMLAEGILPNDDDDTRDYIAGIDISTSKETIDVTLRYAIK